MPNSPAQATNWRDSGGAKGCLGHADRRFGRVALGSIPRAGFAGPWVVQTRRVPRVDDSDEMRGSAAAESIGENRRTAGDHRPDDSQTIQRAGPVTSYRVSFISPAFVGRRIVLKSFIELAEQSCSTDPQPTRRFGSIAPASFERLVDQTSLIALHGDVERTDALAGRCWITGPIRTHGEW